MTSKVSSDGNTLSYDVSDSSASSAAPVKVKGESTRVVKGAAGSHAISGSWRPTKLESVSDNGLLTTWALDGTDSPFMGDPGQTSVSMKKVDDRTIDETDKRHGKVIASARLTLSADGKTMTVAWKDMLHGTNGSFTNIRQ